MRLPPDLWTALEQHAAEHPDKVALRVLGSRLEEQETITYRALRDAAQQRARALAAGGLSGRRILLFQATGVDFFVSFFAALAAGGSAVPLNPRLLLDSDGLAALAADAEPAAILADAATAARLRRRGGPSDALPVVEGLEPVSAACGPLPPPPAPDDIAVVQYTSGSTSAPKGVRITHANFVANAQLLADMYGASSDEITVSWLPLFHDMGLMLGLIWPLLSGTQSVLLRPSTFALRPLSWLQAITRYQGTVSAAPNFAYQMCVEKVADGEADGLDLSSWRIAICGAEPVRPATVEGFHERFAGHGFDRRAMYPAYGLAEATLLVSGGPCGDRPNVVEVDRRTLETHERVVPAREGHPALRLVGCGRPGGNLEVHIVHPATCEVLADGQVGEIWVRGPSVSPGYLRPGGGGFGARLSDGGGYLRTGDRGFLFQGELFVVGRLKDLIIVRGANHAPQDIELACQQSHPALAGLPGAAFTEEDGAEGVIVVHEIARRMEDQAEGALTAMREAITRHGLIAQGIVLIAERGLPLTSSGKIRRQPIREAWLARRLEPLAAWPRPAGPSAETAASLASIDA